MLDLHRQVVRHQRATDPVRDLLLPTVSSVEERPGHLDVAGHSDMRVSLQRFAEQRSRFLAIA
jgi:hypothetical protein